MDNDWKIVQNVSFTQEGFIIQPFELYNVVGDPSEEQKSDRAVSAPRRAYAGGTGSVEHLGESQCSGRRLQRRNGPTWR